jgi:acyl-coenzyme A thioesterase PaaI-like protein
MRDLGVGVRRVDDEMHGSAEVVPEMHVPGTGALRTSILATWVDVVCGHAAIGLFDPGVPVTLDLDVYLHRPPVGCDEVRMTARVQKAGRTVSVLRVAIDDGCLGREGEFPIDSFDEDTVDLIGRIAAVSTVV